MNKKFYIGICTLFLALLTATIPSQAATLTVTNINNSGAGSLRQTIINAAAGDTINFAAGLNGSIFLTSELFINKRLTINGPGANVLGVDGGDNVRVFHVSSTGNGTTTISDLRISNGFSSTEGGGVLVDGGDLTLNNCLITGNNAESGGGAIVFADATLMITNSTITGNSSAVEGGGVSNQAGTLVLTNSTIVGNQAPHGGGVAVLGGISTILNCTITHNGVPAPQVGNIGGFGILSNGVNNLKNTIIAQNIGTPTAPTDVGGTVNSQGNNLIGNTTGGSGFIASDLLNVNPLLGFLANNGGTTETRGLLAGSPAINAGNNTGAPATDQRGVARPQGSTVDIGSYESGVIPPAFGKIVFESTQDGNREIYTMNADFTNQTRLTNNSAYDGAPKWSPDGTKIVFQSQRDGLDEIYTMNSSDGSGLLRLTFSTTFNSVPDWSPDGSKIVFVKGSGYQSEIWVMNTTGGSQMQLTGGTIFGETEPSWSPDGSRIAFSASPTFSGIHELYVMNADGTNRNRLTTNNTTDSYPVWSPDGNSIAYLNAFNGNNGWHAYLINLFNLNIRIVANINDPNETAPAWSPDGTKLAQYTAAGNLYFTNVGGNALLAALAPEGMFVSPQSDWFGFNTPSGTNITAISGTTSVNFLVVGTGGTTTVVPIDPASAGTLPGGYSLGAGFPAYEIATTASYTAPITVCLQVPSVTNMATFTALKLFHNEGGVLIDRTSGRDFATRVVCATVSSLSPFVLAEDLAPTAANVSVGGRVLTANGQGIRNARVTLTDANGATRTAITGSFGYYRFDDVEVGQTYIVSVRSKRFQFSNPTLVITLMDELTDLTFTALPE
jgi:WD40 repeat protein